MRCSIVYVRNVPFRRALPEVHDAHVPTWLGSLARLSGPPPLHPQDAHQPSGWNTLRRRLVGLRRCGRVPGRLQPAARSRHERHAVRRVA
eukprot:6827699-Prymnesium_polylepis.1